MANFKYLKIFLVGWVCCVMNHAFSAEVFNSGLLYDDFSLTLAPGHRTEILGPGFYSEQVETQHTWAIPPLTIAHTEDPVTEYEEFDFLYPVLTYDRFGAEYRWQFFQLLSFAGGKDQADTHARRFTLFPLYFQQRSTDPKENYTAVVPFGGHLDHRLFRDQIDFVMFPIYAKTKKKDVVTRNMPYPFFHLRKGDGMHGWQLWPIVGHEHKEPTTQTNYLGETNIYAGHDRRFVIWPFFTKAQEGVGTANPSRQWTLFFFYSTFTSPLRESRTWAWPLGPTHTIDREKKYEEWDVPWPLIEFAHGEGKTLSRVWPFYSKGHNQDVQAGWYAWPVYKYNHVISAPLDRERIRILFFLYSNTHEKNLETGRLHQRGDLWPFYTHQKEFDGRERLQVLSLLDPIFPNNKSIERDYDQLYALWRMQKNPKTGAASQSLLWNLYRRETAPHAKKISLLFGLFQYQSSLAGTQCRICYIPVVKTRASSPDKSSRQ